MKSNPLINDKLLLSLINGGFKDMFKHHGPIINQGNYSSASKRILYQIMGYINNSLKQEEIRIYLERQLLEGSVEKDFQTQIENQDKIIKSLKKQRDDLLEKLELKKGK